MRFSTVLAILGPASAAFAAQWNVTVGNSGTLTYDPTNLTGVATGDTVVFFFASKNHTVTQSSFTAPCTKLGDTAADSGFNPIDSTTITTDVFPGNNSAIPTFTYDVTNTSAPLWFYCAQTNPVSHCERGMVFAINPTANKTFAAFKQNAENSLLTSASTISSGSSSVVPSITLSESEFPSTSASSTPGPSSVLPPSSSRDTSPSSSDVLSPSSYVFPPPSSAFPPSSSASSPSSDASARSSDAATPAPTTPLSSSSDGTTPSSSSASAIPTNSSPAGTLRVGMLGVLLGGVGLLAFVL